MGRNAGTVFINRNSRKDRFEPIKKAVTAACSKAKTLSFFPKYTHLNGEAVLPFKAALYQARPSTAAQPSKHRPALLRPPRPAHHTAPSYAGKHELIPLAVAHLRRYPKSMCA